MIETETILETISAPAKLKPGARVCRVTKAGEPCHEWFMVIGWESPAPPKPGQSWGSGFLHLRNESGAAVRVGPRKVICVDFRQEAPAPPPVPEFRGGPDDSIDFYGPQTPSGDAHRIGVGIVEFHEIIGHDEVVGTKPFIDADAVAAADDTSRGAGVTNPPPKRRRFWWEDDD